MIIFLFVEDGIVKCTWGDRIRDEMIDGYEEVSEGGKLSATNTPYDDLIKLGDGKHDIQPQGEVEDGADVAAQVLTQGKTPEQIQAMIDEIEDS